MENIKLMSSVLILNQYNCGRSLFYIIMLTCSIFFFFLNILLYKYFIKTNFGIEVVEM